MVNNKSTLYTIHITVFVLLVLITIPFLEYVTPLSYIIFCSLFLGGQLYGLHSIYKYKNGFFTYIFANLLFLGFPLKFSLHTIIKHPYVEPIGSFQFNHQSMTEVITVACLGALGLITSQLLSNHLASKTIHLKLSIPKLPNFDRGKWCLLLFTLSIIFFFINQKFNILLFGFKPSIILPMKGNAIFFNIFTRGFIFLFLLKAFNTERFNRSMILGAMLTMIASIGVYSRMTIIIYLLTIFLYILFKYNPAKKISIYLSFALVFIFSTLITVHFSTTLREYRAKQISEITTSPAIQLAIKLSNLISNAQASLAEPPNNESNHFLNNNWRSLASSASPFFITYSNLALERWIGMEGVMAVQSYPQKSISLFLKALLEKKYQGNSFYTKISEPRRYDSYNKNKQSITTSVPGPIAFFYYTNSDVLVFVLTLITAFICSSISNTIFRISNSAILGIFTAVFMTFDLFQFGIAPRTLIYNWSFTLLYFIFFIITHKNKAITLDPHTKL